uniref:Bradykinin-potentiating peptide 11c n=2 Tax=Crotalinae TaxID=8710 RepID=BP11C_AGKBI|nr:RecName: Full=Bradykinin-potentiating peptide 11c; Short=BPP-11c [Crotalus viridis viridis]
QSAPGNEAIPP